MPIAFKEGDLVVSKTRDDVTYVVREVFFDGRLLIVPTGTRYPSRTYTVKPSTLVMATVEAERLGPTGLEIANHLDAGGRILRPAHVDPHDAARSVDLFEISSESGSDPDDVIKSWVEYSRIRFSGYELIPLGNTGPPPPPLPADMTLDELVEAVDRLVELLDERYENDGEAGWDVSVTGGVGERMFRGRCGADDADWSVRMSSRSLGDLLAQMLTTRS